MRILVFPSKIWLKSAHYTQQSTVIGCSWDFRLLLPDCSHTPGGFCVSGEPRLTRLCKVMSSSSIRPRNTHLPGDNGLPVLRACCWQSAPADTPGRSTWCSPIYRRGLLASRTVGIQTSVVQTSPGLRQSSEHPKLSNTRSYFQTNSHGLAESARGPPVCSLLVTVIQGVLLRDQGSPRIKENECPGLREMLTGRVVTRGLSASTLGRQTSHTLCPPTPTLEEPQFLKKQHSIPAPGRVRF